MAFSGRGTGRFLIKRLASDQRGAGFYRIGRTGAKPASVPIPTLTEYRTATGVAEGDFRTGDIAIVTYAEPNSTGEFSTAFQYNGTTWVAAGEFIDGNLIVDGSVFSNASYSVGIPNVNDAIEWVDSNGAASATQTVPSIQSDWTGSGAFLGFATNDVATSTVSDQEILLVGDVANHIFFDGVALTISGVTLNDPTIFITPDTPEEVEEEVFAQIQAWMTGTTYETGSVVTHDYPSDSLGTQIWVALATNTDVEPGSDAGVTWDNNTTTIIENVTNNVTEVPAVTIGEAAPPSHNHGDLWYDETLGKMFIFIAHAPDTDITVGTWADVTWS